MVPVFKIVGERSGAKNYLPASLLSAVSKVFEKLEIMGLVITWGNVAFFLISSMVFSLPDQVKIFSLWYLIELLGLLIRLGLLEL